MRPIRECQRYTNDLGITQSIYFRLVVTRDRDLMPYVAMHDFKPHVSQAEINQMLERVVNRLRCNPSIAAALQARHDQLPRIRDNDSRPHPIDQKIREHELARHQAR